MPGKKQPLSFRLSKTSFFFFFCLLGLLFRCVCGWGGGGVGGGGVDDTSTLVGHFVSSPREREKRDRSDSRGDEREGQGIKRKINESEETDEIKTPLHPYLLLG